MELMNEARGGFDVGNMVIEGERTWELSYVNEYMTLESNGRRLSTYPDLMTTFDADGNPVNSTSLRQGDTICIVTVPKEKIKVGDGNRYPEMYEPIENALGKPMIRHLKGYLKSQ
jgi:DUF917 family protein